MGVMPGTSYAPNSRNCASNVSRCASATIFGLVAPAATRPPNSLDTLAWASRIFRCSNSNGYSKSAVFSPSPKTSIHHETPTIVPSSRRWTSQRLSMCQAPCTKLCGPTRLNTNSMPSIDLLIRFSKVSKYFVVPNPSTAVETPGTQPTTTSNLEGPAIHYVLAGRDINVANDDCRLMAEFPEVSRIELPCVDIRASGRVGNYSPTQDHLGAFLLPRTSSPV